MRGLPKSSEVQSTNLAAAHIKDGETMAKIDVSLKVSERSEQQS